MKLNLLPTSVAKGKGTGRAIVLSAIFVLACVAGGVFLKVSSEQELQAAKDAANEVKPAADQVNDFAAQADELIKKAEPTQRNIQLVSAMDEHVNKYPLFYGKILQYIPSFFRVTAISGTPASATQVNLSISGIVKDQDEYNNLVLALLRIPGAASIQRQAIPYDAVILPNVLSNDPNPQPYKTSEGRLPPEKSAQLDYYIQKGGVTGYQNRGNFGGDEPGPRGAMPKYNEVTVTLSVNGDLQSPQVRGTLSQFGAAPAAGGAAAAAPAASAPMGMPGGGMPGGMPGVPGGMGRPGGPGGAVGRGD